VDRVLAEGERIKNGIKTIQCGAKLKMFIHNSKKGSL